MARSRSLDPSVAAIVASVAVAAEKAKPGGALTQGTYDVGSPIGTASYSTDNQELRLGRV